MFRGRQVVIWHSGLLLLASFSRPLFTSVHNRLYNLKDNPVLKSAPLTNGNEKNTKARQLNTDYGKLPIYFEPNLGQTNSQVKFIARGGGVTTFLTATEAIFSLPQGCHSRDCGNSASPITPANHELIEVSAVGLGRLSRGFGLGIMNSRQPSRESTLNNRQSPIRIQFLGASSNPRIEGLDQLPGISNYFIGSDPTKWRTNVPHYAKVHCREVYPGIDVVYYATLGQLEYDLILAPGSDPRSVRIVPEGVDQFYIDESGGLVLLKDGFQMRHQKPVVYQQVAGQRQEIAGRYRISGREIGFEMESYDTRLALVIDPVVLYSTPLPGRVNAMTVDAAGNAYVTGLTAALPFATTPGAFQSLQRGESDAFIIRLDASGKTMLYATYLGGSHADNGTDLALDALGNAYVTGTTYSDDFPTTPGAFQNSKSIFSGTFIAKLNGLGSMLSYSTYLGPTGGIDYSIAVDSQGSAYVTGQAGQGFPTTPGVLQPSPTGAFVAKLNSAGSALVYSTFFGSVVSTQSKGIVVDLEEMPTSVAQPRKAFRPPRAHFRRGKLQV